MRRFRAIVLTALCVVAASSATGAGIIHDVTVGPGGQFIFLPDKITIEVGDTVRWTWDSLGHNVGSGTPGNPNKAFFSGPPAPAGTIFEVTFDQAFLDENPMPGNIYDYHCHPHGDFGMVGAITVETPCTGDIDDDGVVGPTDLAALLGSWGPNPGSPADLNGDDVVNAEDLATLLGSWGNCP